jgi:predicted Rossmann fold nucleotide-binding protein DprA/Smf involved in DNA uptake
MSFINVLYFVHQRNQLRNKRGMTMRVAIVGSRKYTNKRRVQEFIFKLKQKYGKDLEIVSGGQREGADGYAKKYALEFDVKYSEFPPVHYSYNQHCVLESYKYGRPYAAWHYHDRNKEIAEYSDVMAAFIPKNTISKGTESALKQAIKKEKKYCIIS